MTFDDILGLGVGGKLSFAKFQNVLTYQAQGVCSDTGLSKEEPFWGHSYCRVRESAWNLQYSKLSMVLIFFLISGSPSADIPSSQEFQSKPLSVETSPSFPPSCFLALTCGLFQMRILHFIPAGSHFPGQGASHDKCTA